MAKRTQKSLIHRNISFFRGGQIFRETDTKVSICLTYLVVSFPHWQLEKRKGCVLHRLGIFINISHFLDLQELSLHLQLDDSCVPFAEMSCPPCYIISSPSSHDRQCWAMTSGGWEQSTWTWSPWVWCGRPSSTSPARHCHKHLMYGGLVWLWAGQWRRSSFASSRRAREWPWQVVSMGEKCHEGSCCHHPLRLPLPPPPNKRDPLPFPQPPSLPLSGLLET